MHFQRFDYLDALTAYHKGIEFHAIGEAPVAYESIDFEHAQVGKQLLTAQIIELTKTKLEEAIRKGAEDARHRALFLVLGTEDQEQIRSYDAKYAEARAFVRGESVTAPQVAAEAAVVGTTTITLAHEILGQYAAAMEALKPIYGFIDGVRRQNLRAVASAPTIEDLENLPEMVWGI